MNAPPNKTADKRYALAIPVLFLLVSIACAVAIIGNALEASTNDISSTDIDQTASGNTTTFRIVISAILTALFIVFTVFSFLEVLEPPTINYKSRIITQSFENQLKKMVEQSETHEVLLITAAYILIPVGIGVSLVTGEPTQLISAGVFVIIAAYTYNNRLSTRKSIRQVLPMNKEMQLSELARTISKDKKTVRKAVLHLISYEGFPAHYDFQTDVITYASIPASQKQAVLAVADDDTIVVESKNSAHGGAAGPSMDKSKKSIQEKALQPCPYCGEMPLVANAMFCSECGASMIASK